MPTSIPWQLVQLSKSITYEVRDAKGATDVSARDTDKFTINVKGSNDAPVVSTTENKKNFGSKPEIQMRLISWSATWLKVMLMSI